MTAQPTARAWNFNYTTRDVILLAALGVVAGVINIGLNQLWDPASAEGWPLTGALWQGTFAWAYLLAYYLVRKPGCLLIIGVLETAIQVLLGSAQGAQTIGWGLAQGLGAELVLAIGGYRSLHLIFFLMAGAGAAQLRTVWTLYAFANDGSAEAMRQYWQAVPFNLLSGAAFSGLVGYLLGLAVTRTELIQPTAS
jgi:energy-coupling factor transport system substrate-specific component